MVDTENKSLWLGYFSSGLWECTFIYNKFPTNASPETWRTPDMENLRLEGIAVNKVGKLTLCNTVADS